MPYKQVGNTLAQWGDNNPLAFTLSEKVGAKGSRKERTVAFDLSTLRLGFSESMLINVRDMMIERRHRVSLRTVESEFANLRALFRRVIDSGLFDAKVEQINEDFLLSLATIAETVPASQLSKLKSLYNAHSDLPLFDLQLRGDSFPTTSRKKGAHGRLIDRILSKVMTRYACVEILRRCEEAYEEGLMDIARFSFVNLAFALYVRPESYRQIKLNDLVFDKSSDRCFVFVTPAKSRVAVPQKIPCRINKRVGLLLQRQRQDVTERYANLASDERIAQLPLFPALKLSSDGAGWTSKIANASLGELSSPSFVATYVKPVQQLISDVDSRFTATNLRHTIATNLAQAGCSATTIQAVLKHAAERACQAYVDIAFQGLINELSDAMLPAFESSMPAFALFRSQNEPIAVEKAIHSDDLDSGRTILTGECGKEIRCEAAPLTCYGCGRFRPCFDADHSLNLEAAQREIDRYKTAGTAYRHLAQKAWELRLRIEVVMVACDRYQQGISAQRGAQ